MLDARNASVCGKRRFPFERGFAGKCWRVPLVASNANGKHYRARMRGNLFMFSPVRPLGKDV